MQDNTWTNNKVGTAAHEMALLLHENNYSEHELPFILKLLARIYVKLRVAGLNFL